MTKVSLQLLSQGTKPLRPATAGFMEVDEIGG
jgi:hypothetical protein